MRHSIRSAKVEAFSQYNLTDKSILIRMMAFLHKLVSLFNGFNMRHLIYEFLSEEKVSLPNFARFAQVQSGNTFAANALSLRCTFFGRLLKAA